jgi:hypothetical protein
MQADPIYQAKWLGIVKEYKTSNQTMKQFCLKHNVKVYQLQYWLKKYKLRSIDNPNQFIELKTINIPITSKPLKVTYGKLSIELSDNFNEETLLKLLKVADQVV